MKNEPLLFINTPCKVKNDGSQVSFDSRIVKKINLSPFDSRIKNLVSLYQNGSEILTEITTKEKIYEGYLVKYRDDIVYLDDYNKVYLIPTNSILEVNIVKV